MEDVPALLESIGGVRTLIFIAAGIVALFLLARLLGGKKPSEHHTTVRCPACGWSGSVSKYKPVCPKCARALSA